MTDTAALLIDSSAWIDFFREDGDADTAAEVRNALLQGRARFTDMVRLELWNGARAAGDQRLLRDLEKQVEHVPTSPAVWSDACDLARSLRSAGITVPATDILIAACARHYRLGLLHRDEHFDRIVAVAGADEGG